MKAETDPLVRKILEARVHDVAWETPVDDAPRLSERLGRKMLLKREDLQPSFSFKVRGSFNRIVQLPADERKRGVIASSAGNHGQGVALAARHLGIDATIVMPRTTPAIKIEAVRALGARVILEGDTVEDAWARAKQMAAKKRLPFVHPYDDPLVIAGQGTIAMEILRQVPENLAAVFVPVGGGGLIAGIAVYVKHVRPSVRVVGVEPEEAKGLGEALRLGRRVRLREVGLFADGVAVRQVGKEPFRVARKFVDEVVTVTTDEICAGIKDIFDDTRSVTEPAGALGVAGGKVWAERHPKTPGSIVAVVSGANMNFDRLRHVSERAEIGEHREALLAVTIPERPGSFLQFCRALGTRSITEFNYRFGDPVGARIFVGVELRHGDEERREIIENLEGAGYDLEDMTANELAKLHVRHMVGGRVAGRPAERLFRFEFPERPGALLRFLSKMGKDWNITLFHYRNHGSAFGRVLVGLEIPRGSATRFRAFLEEIAYPWREESQNPARFLFL